MGWLTTFRLMVFMAVLLAAVCAHLLHFCEQQKVFWEDSLSRIEEHRAALNAAQKDFQVLRAQCHDVVAAQNERLDRVGSESREAKALLPEMKDAIEKIKSIIGQSRVEALMIKDDVKQWQKDYVSVLIELEERLNLMDARFKELEERSSDSSLQRVQREVDSLKDDIKKCNEQLSSLGAAKSSSAAERFPPLPRFDPDWKK